MTSWLVSSILQLNMDWTSIRDPAVARKNARKKKNLFQFLTKFQILHYKNLKRKKNNGFSISTSFNLNLELIYGILMEYIVSDWRKQEILLEHHISVKAELSNRHEWKCLKRFWFYFLIKIKSFDITSTFLRVVQPLHCTTGDPKLRILFQK